jgi:hypothetical protein
MSRPSRTSFRIRLGKFIALLGLNIEKLSYGATSA